MAMALAMTASAHADTFEISNSKFGTLTIEVTEPGEANPNWEPKSLRLSMKCKGEAKARPVLFNDAPGVADGSLDTICDYRPHVCVDQPCTKNPTQVDLHFSKAPRNGREIECNKHIEQTIDLSELCL